MGTLRIEIPVDVAGESDEVREFLRFIANESDEIQDAANTKDLYFSIAYSEIGEEGQQAIEELASALDVEIEIEARVEIQLSEEELRTLSLEDVIAEVAEVAEAPGA